MIPNNALRPRKNSKNTSIKYIVMANDKIIQKGKRLAFLLRHDVEALEQGKIDEHGWRKVDELAGLGFSRELLDEIVASNNKQRYEFSSDGERIRAHQGHSIKVDVELAEATPPDVLYHGTATRFLESIYAKGLVAGNRLYVHLSADEATAINVGSRHGTPVVIKIDCRQMLVNGCKFYLSNNGVWLTEHVATKYFINGFNAIRTIVVIAIENPDALQSCHQSNTLLKEIKDGGYAYVPAKGECGDSRTKYAVFNMSLDAAKYFCSRHGQTSFMITTLQDDNNSMHSEFWEKADKTAPYSKQNNDYIKKNECDERLDMTDATQDFAVIGHEFSYSIPFSIFDKANRLFCSNLERMMSNAKTQESSRQDKNAILDFAINRTGLPAHLRRKTISKGFYDD